MWFWSLSCACSLGASLIMIAIPLGLSDSSLVNILYIVGYGLDNFRSSVHSTDETKVTQ